MTTNDKLLQQFMQAGIDKLDIEDLLSDSFIIIDELYKLFIQQSVSNRPGPKSKFSDSKVLAISWVGEIFSIDSEDDRDVLPSQSSLRSLRDPKMIADFLNTIIIGDKGYISEPYCIPDSAELRFVKNSMTIMGSVY